MKVSLTIPIYLRGNPNNRAVGLAIKHYSTLGFPLHVCGSEGDISRDYCKPYLSDTVKYFEVPQASFTKSSGGDDVLRKKFNDSIATHGPGYDWYCLMGADDLVSLSFFAGLTDTPEPTMAGIGMDQKLIICDLATGPSNAYTVQLRYRMPLRLLPGVNAFNAAAMELCNWQPYQRNGCETGAELYFREFGDVVALPGWVLMVKEGPVLNSTQHVKKRHPTQRINGAELALIKGFVK